MITAHWILQTEQPVIKKDLSVQAMAWQSIWIKMSSKNVIQEFFNSNGVFFVNPVFCNKLIFGKTFFLWKPLFGKKLFLCGKKSDALYLLQSRPIQLYYCCIWYHTVPLLLYLVQSCILMMCIWCNPGLYSCITVVFGTILSFYCCIWCNPVFWCCVFGAILAYTAVLLLYLVKYCHITAVFGAIQYPDAVYLV